MRSRSLTQDETARPFAAPLIPGAESADWVDGAAGAGCWAETAPIRTGGRRPHEAISLKKRRGCLLKKIESLIIGCLSVIKYILLTLIRVNPSTNLSSLQTP